MNSHQTSPQGRLPSSPWERLLEHPPSGGHFVQLYKAGDSSLAKNVCHYVREGLDHGDGALLIVMPEHHELFSQYLVRLGANLPSLLESRQLIFFDAQEMLYRFIVAGQPEWSSFERVIRAAMREVSPSRRSGSLRAYGEMVGLLWKARQYDAAIRLEQFWNKILERSSFSLYCGYAIDLFGNDFDVLNMEGALCTHTHMVPAESEGHLEAALNRALEETLGVDAGRVRALLKSVRNPDLPVMPPAESMILALHAQLPRQSHAILDRARSYYAEACRDAAFAAGV